MFFDFKINYQLLIPYITQLTYCQTLDFEADPINEFKPLNKNYFCRFENSKILLSSALDEEIPGSGCQGTSGLCRRVPWVPRNSHSSGRRSYKVAPLPLMFSLVYIQPMNYSNYSYFTTV